MDSAESRMIAANASAVRPSPAYVSSRNPRL
jgi:hypothetical protein